MFDMAHFNILFVMLHLTFPIRRLKLDVGRLKIDARVCVVDMCRHQFLLHSTGFEKILAYIYLKRRVF